MQKVACALRNGTAESELRYSASEYAILEIAANIEILQKLAMQ